MLSHVMSDIRVVFINAVDEIILDSDVIKIFWHPGRRHISNDRVAVAPGDSRLYRLRDGTLSFVDDHSLLQEQIDSGLLSAEEARHSLNRNLVTRALGVDQLVEVDLAGRASGPAGRPLPAVFGRG